MKEYEEYKIFWGDSHTNVHGEDINHPKLTKERLNRILKVAETHLDFFPIAYYPFKLIRQKGLLMESCGSRTQFESDWEIVEKGIAKANNPGKFVTFLGYEWHGNRRKYGDHNVYYLDDHNPLDSSNTLPELYHNLVINEGIAIPHHTGYHVTERGKDWNFFDENLTPFVEIYSSHGSSEGCNTSYPMLRNLSMGPRTSGGTIQDGLARGHKFGLAASGDNHQDFAGVWGNGLMAVFAKDLTRDHLWESFKKRRVYAVTGDRIKLFFSINNHVMGEVFKSKSPIQMHVNVVGCHAMDRVEIIKNGNLIYTYSHGGRWNLEERKRKQNRVIRMKLRVEFGWGPGAHYGFRKIESREWNGSVTLSDGRIVSVEPCFTFFGQKLDFRDENELNFHFTTQPRTPLQPLLAQHHPQSNQGATFELETTLESVVYLQVNSKNIDLPIAEILKADRVIAFKDDARKMIKEEFGLQPSRVANLDTYWHNSWKVKVHRAIPNCGYEIKLNPLDKNQQNGKNWYYVRVSQLNGQMAWSSPIWVEN